MKRWVYCRDAEIEKRLQEVEALMNKLEISITSFGGNGIRVSYEEQEGMVEGESGLSLTLPRLTDDERVVRR